MPKKNKITFKAEVVNGELKVSKYYGDNSFEIKANDNFEFNSDYVI